MNTKAREGRDGPARQSMPVVIHAPALSDDPLVPEGVSNNGFRLTVREKPTVGLVVRCTIQIYDEIDEIYENCFGRVAWTGNHPKRAGARYIGFLLESPNGDGDRMSRKLKELTDMTRE